MKLSAATHVDRYAVDRIVVSFKDQEFVQEALDELRVQRRPTVEVINAFQLARITITAVTDDQVEAFDGGPAARKQIEDHNADEGLHVEVTEMDVLLRVIRNRAATVGRDLGMGKDRDMEQLEALPHTGGGDGPPRPADITTLGLSRGRIPRYEGPVVRVGVLDSALFEHPELRGRYDDSDVLDTVPPRRAWTGHATFVVGRILLRAPDASVVVRQVLNDNGTTSAWDVALKLAEFLELDVAILNMSLGGWTPDNKAPFLLATAIAKVTETVRVVASAGNHGNKPAIAVEPDGKGFRPLVLTNDRQAKTWPAALPGVVAVGATVKDADGRTYKPTAFTPPHVDWIKAWAPGTDVTSLFLEGEVDAILVKVEDDVITVTPTDLGSFGGYAIWSGTSAAAGDVSGEIARLAATHNGDVAAAWAQIEGRPPITQEADEDVRPGNGLNDWK